MVKIKSCGSSFFFSVFVTCSTVYAADFSSMEVYVTEDLCNQVIDMGTTQGDWKRVLFPYDQQCVDHFDCTLTFRSKPRMKHNETFMCVDLSRMRLYGVNTTLDVIDKEQADRSEKLSTSQYPQIADGMNSIFCVYAHTDLVLRFRASCEKPLDASFVSWMYVYVQGPQTGSIYFVDGTCSHMHSMGRRSFDSKVTLRSHLWPLGAGDLSYQRCKLRLLQSHFYEPARVSVSWNKSMDKVVPAGVTVKICKTTSGFDFERYKVVQTYLTLKAGSKIYGDPETMYPIDYSAEVMFEVTRSGQVLKDPRQSSLLFELVATKVAGQAKEKKEDEEKSDSKNSSDAGMLALKIGGACVGVVLVIAIAFFLWKQKSSSHDTQSAAYASSHAENHNMLHTTLGPTSEGRQGHHGGQMTNDGTDAAALQGCADDSHCGGEGDCGGDAD